MDGQGINLTYQLNRDKNYSIYYSMNNCLCLHKKEIIFDQYSVKKVSLYLSFCLLSTFYFLRIRRNESSYRKVVFETERNNESL